MCLLHCFLEVSCFSPVPLDKWGVVSYASCDHIRVNIMTDSFFTAIQSLDAIMTRVITASINKCCPRLTRTALTFTVWGRAPYICTNTAEKIYRSCQEHVTLTLHLPLPLVAVCYVHTHTHTHGVCVCVCAYLLHTCRACPPEVEARAYGQGGKKILIYQISWKSVQWNSSCFCGRTDGHNEANSLSSQFCRRD